MYTYEQQCVMDLADNYTLLYSFISRELMDAFGLEGERAVREGTRRYGRDRGQQSREEHLAKGYKINMQTLFSVGSGLPKDPRFRRELQELNPEERISHTLVCPMADIWKAYGEREIGRIYCEEFHPACYERYAYDCGHTHLAKTLTQECDSYCAFNVTLRAQNLPDDLRPVCFAQYDPGYIQPAYEAPSVSAKRGFEKLCIKLYYYLLEAAADLCGEAGAEAVERGLEKMAADGAARARAAAAQYGVPFDEKLIDDTYPLSLEPERIDLWEPYRTHGARERFARRFVPRMREELAKGGGR
jgi:hypothetical protein